MRSIHQNFYYLLAALFLLRLFVIPQFGLGVDEAHYALYGMHVDLSYYDHPPLVGWVQYLFMSIFGINEFAVRLSAVIIGAITLWSVYFLIYEITKKSTLALVGALALSGSFMFNALFMMLMPDTLLFALIIPIILATVSLSKNQSALNWLVLGLLLGIAGLAKYTAVLFVIPILLFFIIKKQYKLFYSPKILIAIVPALLLISPVLLWNIQHDWISFTFQSEHVVGSNTIKWSGFFRSIVTQFVAYSPFLSPLAFYGLYRALKSKDERLFLSGLFGLTLILFFTYASLYKTALPHWTALFYLLFIPIGSALLWEKSVAWRRYLKGAIGLSLLITLVLYAELSLKLIPFPDYKSLHRDIYGFDTIMKEANTLLEDNNNSAIAVTNWFIASRANFYNHPYDSDLFLISNKDSQYKFWRKQSPLGRDLLFINTHDYHTDIKNTMICSQSEKAAQIDLVLNHHKVNTIEYVWCRDFQGRK